jgi:DNA-binding LacI/PurR family transcriptional regulator
MTALPMAATTTLKDVAEKAGVSIRTVTRALKNEVGGSAQTYSRVRRTAARLGYIPNIAARNLKIRQSHVIGLVSSRRHTDVWVRERTALQEKLESEGKYLLSGTLNDDEAQLTGMLMEWTGLTRDVVFMSWPSRFSASRILADLPMRFIFVDCLDEPGFNTIITDRSVGVREGIEWFLKTGRRRIARCGANLTNRRKGFDAAFTGAAGSSAEKTEITTPGIEFRHGYEAGAVLIERKVDAVFFDTDRMAFGFYKFASERGIRIPDDVAVIGFDDDPADLYACPQLSTVAHPIAQITEQVIEVLRATGVGPRRVEVPTRFIRRESA